MNYFKVEDVSIFEGYNFVERETITEVFVPVGDGKNVCNKVTMWAPQDGSPRVATKTYYFGNVELETVSNPGTIRDFYDAVARKDSIVYSTSLNVFKKGSEVLKVYVGLSYDGIFVEASEEFARKHRLEESRTSPTKALFVEGFLNEGAKASTH